MTFLSRAAVALDLAGPQAALYGRSAAHLLQLDLDEPDILDVVVPWSVTPPIVPGARMRRTRGTGRRPTVPDPLPHTDIVDTVLDLGDRTDGETCIYWMTEAHRRGLLQIPDLTTALHERRRHRHRALIEAVAEDIASGATSNLEVRYAGRVERAHGLPKAVRQFIVPTTGHRADFAYPEAKLLIELDGVAYHSGAAAERDVLLDRQHAAEGWLTRRYTWGRVVGSACVIAREVVTLLNERGMPDAEAVPCRAERPETSPDNV